MLKSTNVEETDLACNFSILLLHHDDKVTTSDLVGFDLESRDVLSKTEMLKVWSVLNSIGAKEVADVIGSAGPTGTVDKADLKKQILAEINTDLKDAITKDVSELLGKKQALVNEENAADASI